MGVAVVNGKIYAIGGDNSSISGDCITGLGWSYLLVNTNEMYDPAANVWTLKAPMPTARALFATAVYENKIYCMGGYTTNITYSNETYGSSFVLEPHATYIDMAVNEVYDPSTDTWSNRAPMPTPTACVQANTIGDKIYVVAYDTYTPYAYDPISDSWTQKAPAPFVISGRPFMSVVNGKIMTIGLAANYSTYIQAYDPQTDSWSILCPSVTGDNSWNNPAVLQANGSTELYFFDDPATYVLNMSDYSWSNGTALPSNRLCANTAVVDNAAYVIGGRIGLHGGLFVIMNASNMLERYSPINPQVAAPTPSPAQTASTSPSNPQSTSASPTPPQDNSAAPYILWIVCVTLVAFAVTCAGLLLYRHVKRA